MRRILAGMLLLTLLAVAFAAPPIDYALTCGEGGELIGVLSLTEGKVHVALVAELVCDGVDVFVSGPDGAPEIELTVNWNADPPAVTVTIDEAEADADDVDLVVVPLVAIDGMLNAQRLRAAAMEMRREAAERGALDRDRVSWDDEGTPGDGEPGGPPADVPPGNGPGGPPDDAPRGEGPGKGPGGRP